MRKHYIPSQDKPELEHNLMAITTILHGMKGNIIHFFGGHKIEKDMMGALYKKYGLRPNTQIQLLLDKYNNTHMS